MRLRLASAAFWIVVGLIGTASVRAPGQGAASQHVPSGVCVLLLDNEQAIEGEIAVADGCYSVRLKDGTIRVRQQDVRMVCRSYEECYVRMQAASQPDSIHDHLRLASWCTRYGLDELARRELAAAEAIDPHHAMVAVLRRRLEASIAPKKPPRADTDAETALDTAELERIVASLPTPTVESYTAAVQPLLLNQCAAAGCHGGRSESDYQLLRAPANRLPSQRITQRNLAATLEWINTDRPEASPLLTVPLTPHGTSQAAIFTEKQLDQYRRLVVWVYSVAASRQAAVQNAPVERSLLGLGPPSSVVQAAAAPQGKNVAASYTEPPWEGGQTARASEVAQVSATELGIGKPQPKRGANISTFVPKDPFDPEIFNRRFFGPTQPSAGAEMRVLEPAPLPDARSDDGDPLRPLGVETDAAGADAVEELPVAGQ